MKDMKQIKDPSEIPPDMSEEEAREFWDTHEITEEFLDKAEPVPEDMLPPARPHQAHRGALRRRHPRASQVSGGEEA